MNRSAARVSDADARPVIAVTPDFRPDDGAAREAEFAVRANYVEAIIQAGGVPIIVPHVPEEAAAFVDVADGVLLTGTMPGQEGGARRRAFELALIDKALARGKPLLGVCNGMQMIGEALGGVLLRDVPALAAEVTTHIPHPVPDRLAHPIRLEPDTILFGLNGGAMAQVNSLHRHALDVSGRFRVVARAPDGTVEAIEGLAGAFCMGVQWHPEYGLTALDRAIFHEFVARCSVRAGEKC